MCHRQAVSTISSTAVSVDSLALSALAKRMVVARVDMASFYPQRVGAVAALSMRGQLHAAMAF